MKLPQLAKAPILIAIWFFVTYVIPITLVLGNEELANSDIAFQLNLFSFLGFVGLIISISIIKTFIEIKKNNKYGDTIGFASLGISPAFPFWKKVSQLQLALGSLVVFGIIFLLATLLKIGTLTGARVLPQQFSAVDSLAFSTLLVAGSENLLAISVMATVILVLTLFAIKYNLSVEEYKQYYYILPVLAIMVFAYIWHLTVYSGSDYALWVVLVFWGMGAFISLAVGSAIPFLIIHMLNNFFIDFARLFISDMAVYTVGGVVIILPAIIYFLIYRKQMTLKNPLGLKER